MDSGSINLGPPRNILGSSNGRTADSGSANLGSNPSPRAKNVRGENPSLGTMASSSSGLGYLVLIQKIAGSIPAGATKIISKMK